MKYKQGFPGVFVAVSSKTMEQRFISRVFNASFAIMRRNTCKVPA